MAPDMNKNDLPSKKLRDLTETLEGVIKCKKENSIPTNLTIEAKPTSLLILWDTRKHTRYMTLDDVAIYAQDGHVNALYYTYMGCFPGYDVDLSKHPEIQALADELHKLFQAS